jgi:hypothetical protein
MKNRLLPLFLWLSCLFGYSSESLAAQCSSNVVYQDQTYVQCILEKGDNRWKTVVRETLVPEDLSKVVTLEPESDIVRPLTDKVARMDPVGTRVLIPQPLVETPVVLNSVGKNIDEICSEALSESNCVETVKQINPVNKSGFLPAGRQWRVPSVLLKEQVQPVDFDTALRISGIESNRATGPPEDKTSNWSVGFRNAAAFSMLLVTLIVAHKKQLLRHNQSAGAKLD